MKEEAEVRLKEEVEVRLKAVEKVRLEEEEVEVRLKEAGKVRLKEEVEVRLKEVGKVRLKVRLKGKVRSEGAAVLLEEQLVELRYRGSQTWWPKDYCQMKDAYLGAPVVKMTSNGVAQRLKEKGKVRLKELAEEHRDFRSTTGPAHGGA